MRITYTSTKQIPAWFDCVKIKFIKYLKNSSYKPINEIKTHIIQGKNETHLGGAIINERFEYPRYTSYMVSSWLVHFFNSEIQ